MDLSNKKLRADILKEAFVRYVDINSDNLFHVAEQIVSQRFAEAFTNSEMIRCTDLDHDNLLRETNALVNMIFDQLDTLIDKVYEDED